MAHVAATARQDGSPVVLLAENESRTTQCVELVPKIRIRTDSPVPPTRRRGNLASPLLAQFADGDQRATAATHSARAACPERRAAADGVNPSHPTRPGSAPRAKSASAEPRCPPWHAAQSACVTSPSALQLPTPTPLPPAASAARPARPAAVRPATARRPMRHPTPCRRRSRRRGPRGPPPRRAARRSASTRHCSPPSAAASPCAARSRTCAPMSAPASIKRPDHSTRFGFPPGQSSHHVQERRLPVGTRRRQARVGGQRRSQPLDVALG